MVLLFASFAGIWLPGSPFILANSTQNATKGCLYINETLSVNASFNNTEIKRLSKFSRFFFESPCHEYTSVMVLLGGIALSKFGLWILDLVIHQIVLENLDEKQRDITCGAQNSLNNLLDVVKYSLVIGLPRFTEYGYLVMASLVAVCLSTILYLVYAIIEIISKRFYEVPARNNETEMQKCEKSVSSDDDVFLEHQLESIESFGEN